MKIAKEQLGFRFGNEEIKNFVRISVRFLVHILVQYCNSNIDVIIVKVRLSY